ncbi:hypothetical protein STEG23_025789 [Scotinomys teguina]
MPSDANSYADTSHMASCTWDLQENVDFHCGRSGHPLLAVSWLCSAFVPSGGDPQNRLYSPSAPVNVTVRHLKANSAVVSWDVLEDEVVIGFAISQQKKDVRMLRFIQEVNTTTRSCALWDLEEDTEYIVHVQAISIQGQSPASEPLLFKTPREAEKMASKNKDEVTMKEMGRNQQLRTGEVLIIVVVLFMWAGVIALFCRQYDIIKDNEPTNNKEKTKSASETSTPEHQGGGLLRSKNAMSTTREQLSPPPVQQI